MKRSVFLSSTFSDFPEERDFIKKCVPNIDIFVNCAENKGDVGMTLKKTIKQWIDDSDMILLLIGDKYGTEQNNKCSWTQEEFEYAKKCKKRIFAYLRILPEKLNQLSDKNEKKNKKLQKFKKLVENHVANIPRYKYEDFCTLITFVIRDLDRHRAELESIESRNIYNSGFNS